MGRYDYDKERIDGVLNKVGLMFDDVNNSVNEVILKFDDASFEVIEDEDERATLFVRLIALGEELVLPFDEFYWNNEDSDVVLADKLDEYRNIILDVVEREFN